MMISGVARIVTPDKVTHQSLNNRCAWSCTHKQNNQLAANKANDYSVYLFYCIENFDIFS